MHCSGIFPNKNHPLLGAPMETLIAPGWDREISGCRNLALLANVDLIFEKARSRSVDSDGMNMMIQLMPGITFWGA